MARTRRWHRSIGRAHSPWALEDIHRAPGPPRPTTRQPPHAGLTQGPRGPQSRQASGGYRRAVRMSLGALAAGITTWILIGRGNVAASHLICSHRQRPATTCDLSRVAPYPWVQVRGHSWLSVAVDVATDVGQGSSAAGSDRLRRASDSQSGVSRPGSSTGSGDHRSCTLGFVWHPGGLAPPNHAAAQGQPSTEPVRTSCGSAPGLPCGSPWGRPAGCHTLPAQAQPRRFLCPAIPEACPPGEGMV